MTAAILDQVRDAPAALVRFHRLVAQARSPQRADRSAAGTLPMRAARYCDAVTQASAFGWWLFPPIGFSLLWDGEAVFWTYDGAEADGLEGWMPLEAAQFPHFSAAFDAAAPEPARGFSPPFLTALPEPGAVQIWTGMIARTAPDWSLLLRAPANLPAPGGYAMYEGVVESDRWFGPLFTNIRLTRTHMPVRFRPDFPLLQAQPLPRSLPTVDALDDVDVADALGADEWDAYIRTVVEPSLRPERMHGEYAVAARKRRKCPFAAAA